MAVIMEEEKEAKVVQLAEELARLNQQELESMYEAMEHLHKGLRTRQTEIRRKARLVHNKMTRIQEVDFSVGDYVLVGIADHKKEPKLSLGWNGPARVVDFGEHELTYQVQMLGKDSVSVVHASRLKHYADADLDITEELEQHVEDEEVAFYVVEAIEEFREEANKQELLIKWQDFEERSWEPLAVMHRDCPKLVEEFIMNLGNRKLLNRLRRVLKL